MQDMTQESNHKIYGLAVNSATQQPDGDTNLYSFLFTTAASSNSVESTNCVFGFKSN
jgi:hypothetical protein